MIGIALLALVVATNLPRLLAEYRRIPWTHLLRPMARLSNSAPPCDASHAEPGCRPTIRKS